MKTPVRKKWFSQPKDYFVLLLGIISALYLLNFSFGFIEFLPDSLPLVGNVDEAVAAYLLYSVLEYFDVNVHKLIKREK